MHRSRLLPWSALVAVSVLSGLGACVGDDPSGSSPTPDSGTSSGGASSSSSSGASGASSSSSSSGSSGASGSSDAGDEPDAAVVPPGTVDPELAGAFHGFAIAAAAFQLRAVSVDALGGLVVAGAASGPGCTNGAIGVMRLTPTGSILLTFGGIGATCWRSGNIVEGLAVTALPTGDVVAVGARADESYTSPDLTDRGAGSLTMVRLNATAGVVATLSGDSPDGYVLGSHYRARAVAASDTQVLVAGTIRDPLQPATATKGFVAKYTYNSGTFERTWGKSDATVRTFAGVGFAADGSTMVGGARPSDTGTNFDRLFVRTYSANGTPGPDLLSQYERPVGLVSSASALLDPAGSPTLLAATDVTPATGLGTGAVLTRFAQGVVDPGFATAGITRITSLQFDAERSAQAAARDALGRILVLAPDEDGMPVLHRFTSAGMPDGSFGTAGSVRIALPIVPGGPVEGPPTFDHELRADGFVVTDAQSRITVAFPGRNGFYVQRILP